VFHKAFNLFLIITLSIAFGNKVLLLDILWQQDEVTSFSVHTTFQNLQQFVGHKSWSKDDLATIVHWIVWP
jgi:hypothetical protein